MKHFCFEQLQPGMKAALEITITEHDIQRFAELSGDVSPIHVDDSVAQGRGFRGKIAHGALLAAHVSRLLGVDMPGSEGVLQRLEMEFRKPCYADTRLRIVGEVTRQIESVQVVMITVTITDIETNDVIANGRAQCSVASRRPQRAELEALA